ncbi:MAG: DNA polymerase III subunit delta [Cytophagales bacterium]|nr:DNA polymerase III subunit delta [Cytophagales bacterium]MDW8383979.1 DNA polymerase III subunit delta [Flammeovirgaceae bacterium]
MPVSVENVLQELEARKFAPLYFLHGEEPFPIDQITNWLEKHVLSESERSFNQTILYGKEVVLSYVLEMARRFPMMSQYQLIIIKEAQDIAELNKKEGQEKLLQYAQKPVPSTILVFAYKKKLEARTELAKTLDKCAIVVETKPLYDSQLPTWIRDYCKQKKIPIQESAVRILAEYIGNDLSRIANEIEKVCINYPKGIEITDEIIMQHVGISKEYNVFELQTAIAVRDILKANQIIHYFSANPKANPIVVVLSSLFQYFVKVLLVHQNSKKTKDELAKILKVSPFFVSEYQMASQNYSLDKTLQVISWIQQADLQVKGIDSVVDETQVMKELLYKILHV